MSRTRLLTLLADGLRRDIQALPGWLPVAVGLALLPALGVVLWPSRRRK